MLQRAIQSVEAQTLQPKELLVCVDDKGRGSAGTRNYLLAKVRTEWVAFLDDDDEFLPHHLLTLWLHMTQYNEIDHPDAWADLFYPWFVSQGGPDNFLCPVGGHMQNPYGVVFGEEQRAFILDNGNFIAPTVLASTEAVQVVGGFVNVTAGFPPEPYCDRADMGLWQRMLRANARFVHVPVRTWVHHVHPEQTGGLVAEARR